MRYAVKLTKLPNGKFKAESEDLGASISDEFATESEALDFMCDALPGMMYLLYRKNRKPIPMPKAKGEHYIYVPARIQAKILLWNKMIEKGVGVNELARKLNIPQANASRLTDMSQDKASMEAIENALIAIGSQFDLSTVNN